MCESYDITHSDLNPTVLFLGKNNNVTTNTPHVHDNTEMLFVFSGSCQECINGTVYDISAGDIVIINPGQLHNHIIASPSDPMILFLSVSVITISREWSPTGSRFREAVLFSIRPVSSARIFPIFACA